MKFNCENIISGKIGKAFVLDLLVNDWRLNIMTMGICD